jgi:DNA-directed RNA polymerase specialized sigma24 family protein
MNMKTDDDNRQQWLTQLYLTVFPAVAGYISKQGGSLDEAKDIFQDALIIYYEKRTNGELKITHTEKAYLLGIARHLWLHHYQQQQKLTGIDAYQYQQLPAEEPLLPSAGRLLRYLEKAGKKCMDLLQAFYYDQQNMKQIAVQFDLSGERSAAVQKHKCLEKIREKVKEKALTYEDFCL